MDFFYWFCYLFPNYPRDQTLAETYKIQHVHYIPEVTNKCVMHTSVYLIKDLNSKGTEYIWTHSVFSVEDICRTDLWCFEPKHTIVQAALSYK